jgi:hypothetical protein
MIIRGAAIHRDGHGQCGFLTPILHLRLAPFISSPFGFFHLGRFNSPTHSSVSIWHARPCAVMQHDHSGLTDRVSR